MLKAGYAYVFATLDTTFATLDTTFATLDTTFATLAIAFTSQIVFILKQPTQINRLMSKNTEKLSILTLNQILKTTLITHKGIPLS